MRKAIWTKEEKNQPRSRAEYPKVKRVEVRARNAARQMDIGVGRRCGRGEAKGGGACADGESWEPVWKQ
jgi:hypothetical protein